MCNDHQIKILHLEDSSRDAKLVSRVLDKSGLKYVLKLVDNRKDYISAIDSFQPDIVLSDHVLPDINSIEALEILQLHNPTIPLIVVSGTISVEKAVEIMNRGAADYLMKDRPERLRAAIENAVTKTNLEREKVEIQQKLIESETKFRTLVESGSDIFCILNEDYRITYLSPTFSNITGLSSDQKDESIFDILHIIEKDKFEAELHDCLTQDDYCTGNHLFSISDNKANKKFLLTTFKNLIHDTVINGLIVRFNDVTEEKNRELEIAENEEKLRLFFENSLDGIILANFNGKVVSANSAASTIFQMPVEEIIGKTRKDLFDTTDPRVKKLVDERSATGSAKSEIRMIRSDGQTFPAEISTSTFFIKQGDKKLQKTASIFRDISEKQHNRLQIAETGEKLQIAEKIAKLGYWEYYSEADEIYCSNEVYNIIERNFEKREDWDAFLKMVPEEYLSLYYQAKNGALEDSISSDIELKIEVAEDRFKWINLKVEPLKDEFNNSKGTKGTIQDITERKTAFENLELSNNRYKSIINSQNSYFVRIDLQGNYSFCNQRFIDEFGWLYPENDPIGQNGFIDVVPDHYDRVEEIGKKCINNPFTNYQLEVDKIGRNNEIRSTLWDMVYLQNNDGGGELQCVGIDITEKIKAESNNRFQANILAKIGQGVVATNKAGKVQYMNSAAENMYGYAFDDMKDEHFFELIFPKKNCEKLQKNMFKSLKENKTFSEECEARRKDGSYFPIQIVFSAIHNSRGDIQGIICISSDITELKKSEIHLKKLNKNLTNYTKELVAANEGLEQFSYIVSHNLRAPVANIIGISEIIDDEDCPGEVREKLNFELLNNVKKLDTVVRDLNDILKTKADYNNNRELVDFEDLVSDIMTTTNLLIDHEKVSVDCNFEEFPSMVTLKSYLYSIFYNLIINSIKYQSPDRDLKIEITSGIDDERQYIKFRDNGLGMDLTRKKDQIFGLYKRYHYHIEGKGMGLFMVKTQVELLGGKIEVDSEVDEFSEFVITFEP